MLKLNDDGSITLEEYELRAPKVGDFRKLRTSFLSLIDKLNVMQEEDREYTADEVEDVLLGWVVETINTLSDVTVSLEDLPAYVATPSFPNTLIKHWRTVPLGHG